MLNPLGHRGLGFFTTDSVRLTSPSSEHDRVCIFCETPVEWWNVTFTHIKSNSRVKKYIVKETKQFIIHEYNGITAY